MVIPKLILFSFGVAFCILVIISLLAMVITDGGFDIDTERRIFSLVFVLSMIYFVVRKLRGDGDSKGGKSKGSGSIDS